MVLKCKATRSTLFVQRRVNRIWIGSARSARHLCVCSLCRYSHVHSVVFIAKQEINVSACAAFLVYFKTFKYLGQVPKMDQVGSLCSLCSLGIEPTPGCGCARRATQRNATPHRAEQSRAEL